MGRERYRRKGGWRKGEERRRHCYRKLKRVEFIRPPPRLSSLVDSRLTSRSSPCCNENIIHVDSRASSYGKFGEGGRGGSLSEIRRTRLRIYTYTRGKRELWIVRTYSSNTGSSRNPRSFDGNGWPFDAGKIFSEYLNDTIGLFREWYILYLINEQSVLYRVPSLAWRKERERENNEADTSTL